MIGNLFRVLKAGYAVHDAVTVKRGQLAASLGILLISLEPILKMVWPDLPISQNEWTALGVVLAAIYNLWATPASTEKIDALGRTPPEPEEWPANDPFPTFIRREPAVPDEYANQRAKDSESS